MGGGGDDPGMQTPGPPNPMAGPAMDALGSLSPKGSNPTAAMQKMDEALSLAYRLITTVTSQIQMQNPAVAKDGHAVAKTILNMKSQLHDASALGPPPDMMLGMGAAGTPSPMGPAAPSPAGGPVGTA
jgi:hypothetical protein